MAKSGGYANSANGVTDFTTGDPGSRTYIGVYSDSTEADSNSPSAYTWSLIKGSDGDNGTPGANGYVHIAYATAADGSTGFSTTDPSGKTYIGVYSDNVLADSSSPSAYTWSLIKGADGQTPITFDLSAKSINVTADYTGATKSGQLPKTSTVLATRGGTDVRSSTSVSLSPSSSSIVASYDSSTGIISVTTANAAGYIDVTMTNGSYSQTSRIGITRVVDAAPPASQSSATAYNVINLAATDTTYNGNGLGGGNLTLPANASGQLLCTFVLNEYYAGSAGSFTPEFKLQISPVGSSTWSDIGSVQAGSTANQPPTSSGDDPTPGSVNFSRTATGLTAGQQYNVRINSRRLSGTSGVSISGGGTLSISM